MDRPEQMTAQELLEKQQDGTLTPQEQVQYLMVIRGKSRQDAEGIVYQKAPIITDTVIHLPNH